MLKAPPQRSGERRLAIERESPSPDTIVRGALYEEAFGAGRVYSWDEGEVDVAQTSPDILILTFVGKRLSGKYELRHMRWYPGDRWLLEKAGDSSS